MTNLLSHSKGDFVRLPQKTFLFKKDFKGVTETTDIRYGFIVDQTNDGLGPVYEVCVDGEYWFVGPQDIYSTGA